LNAVFDVYRPQPCIISRRDSIIYHHEYRLSQWKILSMVRRATAAATTRNAAFHACDQCTHIYMV